MSGRPPWGALAAIAAAALPCAAQDAPAPGGALTDLPSFGESFVRMLVSLGVVVALLLLAVKLLPRWLRRVPKPRARSGEVEVLSVVPLEPRKRLYLVRVCGKKILVGSSDAGLCRLAGEELNEATPGPPPGSPPGRPADAAGI